MGVVYKAYDTLIQRAVAVKTLNDLRDRSAIDLFYKEWGVLASLVHPNIVQVYDVGEFQADGETVPFFVMPLLPGQPLSKLIYDKSRRLSVTRAVDIVCQACRGIQAAHEANLVHRDIKPSNILVLDDDSVKIIDFGVAHLIEKDGSTGLKGTPFYMAPEQVRLQRPSALSDIYALGLVAYEALTRQRPVEGTTDSEIAEAILHHIPPAASDLNPEVSELLSRVLHKAMAKQPWHRFASARELSETLQKVLRNEPVEIFDPGRIQPRIDRAQTAFDAGEFDFAAEVVAEIEAEGCLDPQLTLLRRQLNEVQRRKRVQSLIEGATRCLDEQEYAMALRKVREALELDPEDGTALSLRSRIEASSQSHQIDDGLEQAGRHLANASFGEARQALDGILETQPDHSQARALLSEVNERENEYTRAQEQKTKLHNEAVSAWQKGEISSALSKLDRLLEIDVAVPQGDAERTSQYQKLYQRVRSEHEAVNNAYSEARGLLEQGEFSRALQICDQYLNKYPGHAMFRALRLDVEQSQSRSLSSYVAEIDRRAAAEPDLDKRVGLLEEACGRYPGEAHFERGLEQARQRRELLQSIVGKARELEEAGHCNEAIEQWKILESIDPAYPGLQIEIERLAVRRGQQARAEAKAAWVERIERELAAGDAERAAETCSRALEEFAGDAELLELAEAAQHHDERAAQAVEWLAEAKRLLDQGQLDDAVEKLRGAIHLDKSNPALRAPLADGLLEQARKLIHTDWRQAEALVNEADALHADQPLSRSLRPLIDELKREEAVSWCLTKARQLRSEGKIDEALQVVERVLATYPGVSRLERLRDTLRPLAPGALSDPAGSGQAAPPHYATTPGSVPPGYAAGLGFTSTPGHGTTPGYAAGASHAAKSRDLEELRLLSHQAEQPAPDAIKQGLAARTGEIERRWPEDDAVRAAAAEVLRKLGTMPPSADASPSLPAKPPGRASTAGGAVPGVAAETAPLAAVSGGAIGDAPAPARSGRGKGSKKKRASGTSQGSAALASAAQASAVLPSAGANAAPAGRQSRTKTDTLAAGHAARKIYLWLIAAAAVCAVLVLIVVGLTRHTAPPPPELGEVQVTAQPGAKLVVTGGEKTVECVAPDCRLSLPPGQYTVQASLAGYQPARETLSLGAGAVVPLAIEMQPLPVLLRVVTDLQRGSIVIGGQEVAAPLDQGFVELILGAGTYPVEVRSGRLTASMQIDVEPGRAPRFEQGVASHELQAYVLSSFAGSAELRSSETSVAVQVDGADRGAASDGTLQLAGLAPGMHEMAFSSGDKQIRRNIEIGEGPVLTAILITDRNLGSVIVETGVPGAEVLVEDGRYRQKASSNGRARFTLTPGDYNISVSKEGHETPAPQTFTVRKGDETRVSFELPVKPQMASLQLAGAPPGAQVWIDNRQAGEVDPGGNFSTEVTAGPHHIELRNLPEMFVSQAIEKQFGEGATVSLTGIQLPLRTVKGKIQIQVEPAGVNAAVTIKPAGGAEQSVQPGTRYEAPGDYIVTATAPGYQKSEAGRRVSLGQTTVFRLTLTREVVQQARRSFGLADLGKVDGFSNVDGVMVRKGGDYAVLPLSPSSGTYTFTANVRGGGLLHSVGIGKAHIQWVVDYADIGNHVLFQLGDDALSRTVVSGGQSAETVKIPYDCPKSDYYSIAVEVTPGAVTHKLLCEGKWIQLDQWRPEGENLADGKFGFFVPGRTTLAISHFEAVGP